jgi:hypothetical protein
MIDLLIPLAANGGAPVQTPSIFSPVSSQVTRRAAYS